MLEQGRFQLVPSLPPGSKFVIVGFLLAAIFYAMTSFETPPRVEPESPTQPVGVVVPVLDHTLLATASDATRRERLELEPEPLKHLLTASLDVGPTVAEALGMPDPPIPVATLRQEAAKWRSRWLYYEGKLEQLSGPSGGHPNRDYRVYEATIRCADGEAVMAAFSLPPPEGVAVGSWVRVEGYLLKLRDLTYPTTIDQAPMLVGRQLYRSYERWAPVMQLDPAVLAQVDDTSQLLGSQLWRTVEEDEGPALWHLAAYARDTAAQRSLADWRKVPLLIATKNVVDAADFTRGAPQRLFGPVMKRRTTTASPNPAGITHWTTMWLQVREYGGKLVPIWIPQRVDIPLGTYVEAHTFFYRMCAYETLKGDQKYSPLFVAAAVQRSELKVGASIANIGAWLAGAVCVMLIGAWLIQRRAKRDADQHAKKLAEQRQRARQALANKTAGAKPTGAS